MSDQLKAVKIALAFVVAQLLVYVALFAGIIYVAAHFLKKVW